MFYLLLLAKLCWLPSVDDFKMVAQMERTTHCIMSMNVILYCSLYSLYQWFSAPGGFATQGMLNGFRR